jgi:hypothetical protein
VIGSAAISWLTVEIGTQQTVNTNVVLGAILLIFVLLVPKGIAPVIMERFVPWVLAQRNRVLVPADIAREGKA